MSASQDVNLLIVGRVPDDYTSSVLKYAVRTGQTDGSDTTGWGSADWMFWTENECRNRRGKIVKDISRRGPFLRNNDTPDHPGLLERLHAMTWVVAQLATPTDRETANSMIGSLVKSVTAGLDVYTRNLSEDYMATAMPKYTSGDKFPWGKVRLAGPEDKRSWMIFGRTVEPPADWDERIIETMLETAKAAAKESTFEFNSDSALTEEQQKDLWLAGKGIDQSKTASRAV